MISFKCSQALIPREIHNMGVAIETQPSARIHGGHESARTRLTNPLSNSGSLSAYEHNDITTSIGREIADLQIKELLAAKDGDTLIRDLAITGKLVARLQICRCPLC